MWLQCAGLADEGLDGELDCKYLSQDSALGRSIIKFKLKSIRSCAVVCHLF